MRDSVMKKQSKRIQSYDEPTDVRFFEDHVMDARAIGEEGDEDEEELKRLLAKETEAELEHRTRYKMKTFGGESPSCVEANAEFKDVRDAIEKLKDEINPVRIDLRKITARVEARKKKNAKDQNVSPPPKSIESIDTLEKKNADIACAPECTVPATRVERVNIASERKSLERKNEEEGGDEKFKNIETLRSQYRAQTMRAESFYRRCQQLEREKEEWKKMYTREASRRADLARLESERSKMINEIDRLKTLLRREKHKRVDSGGASRVSGAQLFVDRKNLERVTAKLKHYRELYELECRKNGSASRARTPQEDIAAGAVSEPLTFECMSKPKSPFPGIYM
eukprot:g1266.t1